MLSPDNDQQKRQKHKKQLQRIWEILINAIAYTPQHESKIAKKFKRIL